MRTTLAHRLYRPLRASLPTPLAMAARSIGTAILTPLAFARDTGHFRSSLLRKAVDRLGEPMPWYTYPCIDFLRGQDVSSARVLEFGAGQSTLWWGRHARSVLALEADENWIERLRRDLPSNATVRAVDPFRPAAGITAQDGDFDIIVVDGLLRETAAEWAMQNIGPTGAIIFDNSDSEAYHWHLDGRSVFGMFHDAGFLRADFYGYAPGVILSHCTSILFRPDCLLFCSARPPRS